MLLADEIIERFHGSDAAKQAKGAMFITNNLLQVSDKYLAIDIVFFQDETAVPLQH
jgi:hypothetical protein